MPIDLLLRQALLQPELQRMLQDPAAAAVDIVVSLPMLGGETGAWVAHRLNASLVDLFTPPFILPWMATNADIPYNPAVNPLPLFPFGKVMTFGQRVINTIMTAIMLLVRKHYILPKVDFFKKVYIRIICIIVGHSQRNYSFFGHSPTT